MLPPGLKTAQEAKAFYVARYDTLIASGEYNAFLYPWATAGFGLVIIYLLIDHRRSPALASLRYPLFGLLLAFEAWCVRTNIARTPHASYGVGLISAWGTLWTASLIFVNDCQRDFKRIERSDQQAYDKYAAVNSQTRSDTGDDATGSRSKKMNDADLTSTQGPHQRTGPLFWQAYPAKPFIERLDWVVDAFTNFRGLGWSFETNGIPAPPAWVEAELNGKSDKAGDLKQCTTSKTGLRRYSDRRALLKIAGLRFLVACLAIDAIKTTMHLDPYFWGYTSAPPPTFLPLFIQASPGLTKTYRLLLALAGLYTALTQIFGLGPLVFAGLLGPRIVGLRGEAWMNPPDFYGSLTPIFDKGLAGWWGGWWHQTFRYGFEAPTTRILEAWSIDKRSTVGRLLGVFIAFTLSGCLHACGSYTLLGDTRPFLGPFRFFVLQAVGIVLQQALAQALTQAGIAGKVPKSIRQWTNFVFAHAWLWHTAPLLVDDFAQGGVWLYEPLAISPLRILGFGAKDETGWGLWNNMVFWRQGKHWLDTGIAF